MRTRATRPEEPGYALVCERGEACLPVLGTRGRGGPAELLRGSAVAVRARRCPGHFGLQLGCVAHAVLHHSACAVAVVLEPA